ncbi:hypothetical protein RJT34_25314 [Clitoria ternatea]|uniref:Uncharacterized protein n=1 Tax=Clitoria ternatea TaxID=43366 RepID=A0AAN9IIE0_CLITE
MHRRGNKHHRGEIEWCIALWACLFSKDECPTHVIYAKGFASEVRISALSLLRGSTSQYKLNIEFRALISVGGSRVAIAPHHQITAPFIAIRETALFPQDGSSCFCLMETRVQVQTFRNQDMAGAGFEPAIFREVAQRNRTLSVRCHVFRLSSEDWTRLKLTQKKSLEGKSKISPIDLRAEARASSSVHRDPSSGDIKTVPPRKLFLLGLCSPRAPLVRGPFIGDNGYVFRLVSSIFELPIHTKDGVPVLANSDIPPLGEISRLLFNVLSEVERVALRERPRSFRAVKSAASLALCHP